MLCSCGPYAKEPGELGPIVHMVGWYVLDRRVQFQGGETIGTDEDPVGRIHLGWSGVEVDRRLVYLVVLETPSAAIAEKVQAAEGKLS